MSSRLNLGGMGDDYVLGAMCKKLGLVQYALRTLEGMVNNNARIGLFYKGVEDADTCQLEDFANDFWEIRKKDPRQFDIQVSGSIGAAAHREVLEIIENREEYKYTNPIIEEFFSGMDSGLGVDQIF